MNLKDVFMRIERENWIDALFWLVFSPIGGLMPLWGLWVLLTVASQTASLQTFARNGEFALYSAAMLSAAVYAVSKESTLNFANLLKGKFAGSDVPSRSAQKFPGQRLFWALCLFFIVFSTFLFAGATFANLPNVGITINTQWLELTSISIFIISLGMSFLITAIDNSLLNLSEAEYNRLRESDVDQLAVEVDSIRKGETNAK